MRCQDAGPLVRDFVTVTLRTMQRADTPPFIQAGERGQFVSNARRKDQSIRACGAPTALRDDEAIINTLRRACFACHDVRRRIRRELRRRLIDDLAGRLAILPEKTMSV